MSYDAPKNLAEELAQKAMSMFTPESNADDDDPGGQHDYRKAIIEFQKILDKRRRSQ